MPIYEYKCESCEHTFEKLVLGSKDQDIRCPNCSSPEVKKLLSSINVSGRSVNSGCGSGASRGFS